MSLASKSNKQISKGNRVWKKVNKLAHRLHSRNVPNAITSMVDNMSNITPDVIRNMSF